MFNIKNDPKHISESARYGYYMLIIMYWKKNITKDDLVLFQEYVSNIIASTEKIKPSQELYEAIGLFLEKIMGIKEVKINKKHSSLEIHIEYLRNIQPSNDGNLKKDHMYPTDINNAFREILVTNPNCDLEIIKNIFPQESMTAEIRTYH